MDTLVSFEPKHLQFNIRLQEQTYTNLVLHNISGRRLAFKVKTTCVQRYSVRPSCKIVEPNEQFKVLFGQKSFSEKPDDLEDCRDRFQLLVASLDEFEARAADNEILRSVVNSSDPLMGFLSVSELWSAIPSDMVQREKLPVVLKLVDDVDDVDEQAADDGVMQHLEEERELPKEQEISVQATVPNTVPTPAAPSHTGFGDAFFSVANSATAAKHQLMASFNKAQTPLENKEIVNVDDDDIQLVPNVDMNKSDKEINILPPPTVDANVAAPVIDVDAEDIETEVDDPTVRDDEDDDDVMIVESTQVTEEPIAMDQVDKINRINEATKEIPPTQATPAPSATTASMFGAVSAAIAAAKEKANILPSSPSPSLAPKPNIPVVPRQATPSAPTTQAPQAPTTKSRGFDAMDIAEQTISVPEVSNVMESIKASIPSANTNTNMSKMASDVVDAFKTSVPSGFRASGKKDNINNGPPPELPPKPDLPPVPELNSMSVPEVEMETTHNISSSKRSVQPPSFPSTLPSLGMNMKTIVDKAMMTAPNRDMEIPKLETATVTATTATAIATVTDNIPTVTEDVSEKVSDTVEMISKVPEQVTVAAQSIDTNANNGNILTRSTDDAVPVPVNTTAAAADDDIEIEAKDIAGAAQHTINNEDLKTALPTDTSSPASKTLCEEDKSTTKTSAVNAADTNNTSKVKQKQKQIDYDSQEYARAREIQMNLTHSTNMPELDEMTRHRVAVERAGELSRVIQQKMKSIDDVQEQLVEARHRLSDARMATRAAYDVKFEISDSGKIPIVQIGIMAIISGALIQLLI